MAQEGVGEEATTETRLHHHPSMPDVKDHFGILSDPFLLTVFNMIADAKALMNVNPSPPPQHEKNIEDLPLDTITRWEVSWLISLCDHHSYK
ncbi:hypothetical protein QJS10_CPA10g01270 [Acorus calamus]|uniref:Uncharacterized protein n=1 Tax=Acorus calamus TaxID=4465 RepID=A0AAV9E0S8_ACOCL|nr:hypothetical protein QJS10_CPA10g01270 [Acorus calamus]